MNRIKLYFDNQHKILDFIIKMENFTDACVIENEEGYLRVNAHSINGALYAARDFDSLYFVNNTNPGTFPDFINDFME